MARRLDVPVRTWYNYESGVTVPAEVLLRFMELTEVETAWLLRGEGPIYRQDAGSDSDREGGHSQSVESLLRTALKRLEERTATGPVVSREPSLGSAVDHSHADIDESEQAGYLRGLKPGPGHEEKAYRTWIEAQRDGRIVRAVGEAMIPIVGEGAQVAYAAEEETAEQLDGALVVVWIDGQPTVRWFRKSGGFGVLGVENPGHMPSIQLIDLDSPKRDQLIRRVLWISTPH